MKNKLLNKFLSFSVGSWIGIIISLISTPIITRMTNPENLGKASMYEMIINFIGVTALFGIDQAYVRFFYEEDESKRKILLRKCIIIPILICFIFSIFIFLLHDYVSLYLFSEKISLLFYSLIPLGIILTVINRFSTLVIRMKQRGKLFSFILVLLKTFIFVFSVIFLNIFDGNFIGLVLGSSLSLLSVTLISIILERKEWFYKSKNHLSKHSQKDILKYGSHLAITGLIAWIFRSTDKIFIKYFNSMTELGIYVGAFKIVGLLGIIQTTFSTFWTPVSFEHFENNPNDTKFYEKFFFILSTLMIIVLILTISFRSLFVLLLGEKYRAAIMIIPFLTFMPVLRTISEITVVGINFKKKVSNHLVISVGAALINIIANFIFVPKFGAIGAAFGSLLAYFVFFFLRTWISAKYFQIEYNLKLFYFQIILTLLYSIYASIKYSVMLDIICGLLLILIVIIINYKRMVMIIRGRNESNFY